MPFVVETSILSGWENCWSDIDEGGNETPSIFASREEAEAAITEHLEDVIDAVAKGDMSEPYSRDDFRIVEI